MDWQWIATGALALVSGLIGVIVRRMQRDHDKTEEELHAHVKECADRHETLAGNIAAIKKDIEFDKHTTERIEHKLTQHMDAEGGKLDNILGILRSGK